MTRARAIFEFRSGICGARGWLHLAALLLLVHLPQAAGAAQIGPSKFDHLTTGYELMGAHLIVPCESCHVGAIFKGTPRECVSCHSQGARITATFKGQDHVLSSPRCEACHTEAAWAPASHFDHQEVQGSCATCHNGVTATGMRPNHIASTTDCGACHSVYGWKPVLTVDHTQVNGTCASCHNGTVATGKPGNHIVTTDSCDNCHTTLAWKPANVKHVGNISNCAACHNGTVATGKTATHMPTSAQCGACHSVVVWKPQTTVDHTQVIGTCYSCHNGTIAAGKATNHPPNTDNTCENCHATTAWTPANVNHNGITSNCVSCHNNKTASGKASTHIATSDSCQACHSVLVWKPPVTVDHTQVLGTCASCHNGSTALGRPANHIPAAADCGVCHLTTIAFGPGTGMNHTGITSNCASCHETGKSWYGVTMVVRPTKAQDPNHPTAGDCSQCHASTTSFTVDTSGGKPPNHIPTTQSCTLCHSNPADYSIYKMDHAGVTGCIQCHGAGLSFANIVPKEPPPKHIPTATACETCHGATNFTAFGPGTAMNHAGISSNCASCHETGDSWYGVTMVDRPTKAQDPNHPATGDCSQCHSSTTTFTVVTAGKPANHIPTTQTCTLCHSNASNYAIYTMNHTGIAIDCAQCHGAGLSFANIVPKEPPANHMPILGLACENCHSPTNFGAFGPGTKMNHTGITGNCASCHETGDSWYGVTMVDRPTKAQDANHPTTGECSNCHSSTVSFSNGITGGNKPANHIPTTQVCTLCHTTAGNYALYVMNHQGIAANCEQCHAAGLTFANITPKEPPATHLPIGGLPCANCHSTTVFTAFGPGTLMNHTGITSNCASCHETGKTWYGVSIVDRPTKAQDPNHPATGDCSTCHASTTSFTVDTTGGKPPNHIPTSQSCTLCHGDPGDYSIYKMDHTGITTNCTQCHGPGLSFANIVPKEPPSKHIPTTTACETCHVATNFTAFGPGTAMNHTGISSNCASCHETGSSWYGVTMVDRPTAAQDPNHPTTGDCSQCHSSTTTFTVVTAGKPANHIPTSQTCALCHSNASNYAIYTMNHTGIVTNCAQCHGTGLSFANIVPKEQPANHIPVVGLACENCHSTTVFTAFGPGTAMKHTGITGNCASCHETGRSWYGVTMVDRPTAAQDPNHPTTGECSNCHSSTVSFSNGITGGNKPANHIPTTQVCTLCHTTAGNYALYVMNHQGITTNCEQCHAAGLTFANITPKEPPATHLPISGLPCANCHSSTVFTAFGPGTAMKHTGISSNCASCHETGKTWYGVTMVDRPTKAQDANHPTTGDCSQCHGSTVSFTTALAKPSNHIPTSQACTLCHTNAGNYAVYTMSHAGITSNCAQCHAAGLTFASITPKEPPATHLPISGLACENCHSPTVFTAFGPGTAMKHTGITSNCASCHETGKTWYGVTMVDRPTTAQDANHPTTGDCSNCHASTTSFTSGVAKPSNHIPTSQACTLCHTNATNFAVYTMSHSGITNNCAQCHAAGLTFANITPKEPPATHLPISGLACENCHSPTVFTAFGPGTAMKHTGITSNCASCHETGKTWYGVTMVDRPTKAQDASHPTTGDCSNCHSSTTSFTAGVTSKPANHIPTLQACTLCHTNSANYAVFTMSHSGITNNCAQCHAAGLTFANITPKEPPATHLPIGSLPCENCHSPTVFTAFGPGTTMKHTGITSNCASCHETGKSWYGVTMVDRPTSAQDPNHPTTGDCSNCHSSTTSFNTAVAKPSNHIPTSQACTLCHSNSANYAVYTMNHAGITSNCIQCHGTGLSFANIVPKEPPSNHIPTASTACESCHSPSVFTAFSGTKMNHTPVSAMTCESCHETGDAWYGVQMVDRPKGHHTGTDCKGCHGTNNFSNAAAAAAATAKPAATIQSVNKSAAARPAATSTAAAASTRAAAASTRAAAATAAAAEVTTTAATTATATKATPVAPAPAAATAAAAPAPAAPATFNLAGAMATLAGRVNVRGAGPQQFSHVDLRRECSTCHNGLIATGLSRMHIPSTGSCSNCHTTIAWTPARFEHRGVVLACTSCHDSVHATGKPARHVQTPLACATCHSTTAWIPVIFRHSGVSASCQSCHNGLGASGKPTGHMMVSLDCSVCHRNTLSWSPAAFVHNGSTYPGEHRAALSCTRCHTTNTEQVPWPRPANAPACAACHERNYQPAPHTKYGNVKYTASELKNCSGACHVYSDVTLKSIVKPRSGPQHQVSSGQF